MPVKILYFPVAVSAGLPALVADYMEESTDLNELLIKNPSSTFLVKIEGESMVDFHIPPFSKVLVDRSRHPSSGDIIVGVMNGEFIIKQLCIAYGTVMLVPGNPRYKTIHVTEEMHFSVWGVVTQIFIDPKNII
ncbi:MAG: translesion error-prone DNA polymerase V autoproteolytic subunit [Chitinophagales bacterium]|nr:translesion error-prone DNA polymerase V autoproteolytic subunit [Chitinophagales bacterium]